MRQALFLIAAAVALFLLAGAVARADENPCLALNAAPANTGLGLSNSHSEIPNATGGAITPDRQGTGVYGQSQFPEAVPTDPPLLCGALTVAVVTKVARTCNDFAIDYLDGNGKMVWSTAKLSPAIDAISDPSTCTYNVEKIPTNRKLMRAVRFTGDPQALRDRGVDPSKFAIPARSAVYFNGVRKAMDRIDIAMHP